VVEHPEFAALFHAEYAKLCRISARFIHDRGLAEQIVSQSFLKVWRHRDHVDWSRPFPYLYRVVINECKDALDACGRQRDTASKVALLDLVARQRTSVEDVAPRVFEDLPEADVAEIMGISIGSVKSHYSRALTGLRRAVVGGVTA
jgi:DNA-directed RNA polymerase specialized sigma24 family protein